VALLANGRRLCQPGDELGVDIVSAFDGKVMHVSGENAHAQTDAPGVRFRRDLRKGLTHLKAIQSSYPSKDNPCYALLL
jgi:hypothetical protein